MARTSNNKLMNTTIAKQMKAKILVVDWYQMQFHVTMFHETRVNPLDLLTFYLRVHRIGEYVTD